MAALFGGILSFLGLLIILGVAFVALMIGLVVRAFRGPRRT